MAMLFQLVSRHKPEPKRYLTYRPDFAQRGRRPRPMSRNRAREHLRDPRLNALITAMCNANIDKINRIVSTCRVECFTWIWIDRLCESPDKFVTRYFANERVVTWMLHMYAPKSPLRKSAGDEIRQWADEGTFSHLGSVACPLLALRMLLHFGGMSDKNRLQRLYYGLLECVSNNRKSRVTRQLRWLWSMRVDSRFSRTARHVMNPFVRQP
jgi:hypothetical protein